MHALENKGVDFRSLAKERARRVEVHGNTGVKFLKQVKECASL
jgi:hypothetical protein